MLDLKCDYRIYICKSCHSEFKKNKVPCQAVADKLLIEWLSREYRNLRQLETEKSIATFAPRFRKINLWHLKFYSNLQR